MYIVIHKQIVGWPLYALDRRPLNADHNAYICMGKYLGSRDHGHYAEVTA